MRARIVSSRQGEVASWTVNGSRVEAKLTGIEVAKGDTLDFVVDSRKDTENDGFRWSSIIKVASSKENGPKEITWISKDEFRGPPAQPLGVWERYARVLLQMNEFAFVD